MRRLMGTLSLVMEAQDRRPPSARGLRPEGAGMGTLGRAQRTVTSRDHRNTVGKMAEAMTRAGRCGDEVVIRRWESRDQGVGAENVIRTF